METTTMETVMVENPPEKNIMDNKMETRVVIYRSYRCTYIYIYMYTEEWGTTSKVLELGTYLGYSAVRASETDRGVYGGIVYLGL